MKYMTKIMSTRASVITCGVFIVGLMIAFFITRNTDILIFIAGAVFVSIYSLFLNIASINEIMGVNKNLIAIQKEFGSLKNGFPNIIYRGMYKDGTIYVTDNEGIIPEMYKMTTDSIKGKDIKELLPEQICSQVLSHLADTKGDASFDFEITFRDKIYHNRMKLRDGEIIGYATDITELKKAKDKIKQISQYDSLTGLPNRIMLDKKLGKLLAAYSNSDEEKQLALVVLDLDNFKTINDTKGYTIGDKILVHMADLLKNHIGPKDTLARLGSDEFAIILPNVTGKQDVEELIERLIELVKKPLTVGNYTLELAVCIGISMFPKDCYDARTLLKNADMAMSKSKSLGKNTYQFFTSDIYIQKLKKIEMQEALKSALKNDEFKVYYQPQMDIHNGELVGTEALVRWLHPGKGMVSPGEFIPLAEETGLILQIGEWVLRTSCEQHMEWINQGFRPVRMSVNLSALQFGQKDLVEIITRVLEETGMDPKYLNLEITESTSMSDIDVTISVLKELREMGIEIAIDDFGTGYSSFNYLTQFPINTLKIDRSFINDILTKNGETVTRSIIILANGLNLNVVAEGVETNEQLDLLKTLQCHEVQGFLFSPALPKEKFEQFLTKSAG